MAEPAVPWGVAPRLAEGPPEGAAVAPTVAEGVALVGVGKAANNSELAWLTQLEEAGMRAT